MQQILLMQGTLSGVTATNYLSPVLGRSAFGTTETENTIKVPIAATFRNLRVVLGTPPTGSQTRTFALMVNGSPSALTVAFNSGTGGELTDTSNDVSISANDEVSLRHVGASSPAATTFFISMEFEAASGNQSIYGFGGSTDVLSTAPTREALLWGGKNWRSDASTVADLVSHPGTITNLTVRLNNAPTAGKSRTFTIYKNGTAQDGTGGTPNTAVTISDTATEGESSFSLSVVAGDELQVRHTTTGAPTTTHRAVGCVAFTSGSGAKWMMGSTSDAGPTGTSVLFQNAVGGGNNTYVTSPEADRQHCSNPTSFWLSGFRLKQATAPSSGKSWTWTLRKNTADSSLQIVIADSATSGTYFTTTVEVADGDEIAMEATPTNTPNNATATVWSFVASNSDPGPGEGGSGGVVLFVHHYKQQGIM